MNKVIPLSDKVAITLSGLCIMHCVLLPVILLLLPSAAAQLAANEEIHLVLVVLVVPISLYALTMGCRQHNKRRVILMGAIGLSCLLMAITIENNPLIAAFENSIFIERALTIVGALLIGVAHVDNYRYCQRSQACDCSKPRAAPLVTQSQL